MLFENIRLAFSSMAASKLRTLLSLLGIVIGVASVVAILNLGGSVRRSISDSMSQGGIDLISLSPSFTAREALIFTEEFSSEIMRNVSGIESVLAMQSSSATVREKHEIVSGTQIQGVSSDFFPVNNAAFLDGEAFSAMDNITRRQVAVLGHDIAEELFPAGGAVGSYISIFRNQARSYLVTGVLEEKDSTAASSYNSVVFIPYNTYTGRFRSASHVGTYVIKVSEDADPIAVSSALEEYMDNLVGEDYFRMFSPATIVEMADEVTGTFAAFLAAIAAISLLVGGIGIMNIMLVSVAERTKEIGIRKALGASPRIIMGQFIAESIVLTSTGGLIGLLLGIAISYAGAAISGWTHYFSAGAVAVAVGFSVFVGVFFGWYPAKKAASLNPIDALSHE